MRAEIIQWAQKWGVCLAALNELYLIQVAHPEGTMPGEDILSESYTQSRVRLEASSKGIKLWRNNVGVLVNEVGTPIRFGLANDSKKLNESIKSGDLIGWRPILITPEMVGSLIGQFVSRECKRPGWKWTGSEREHAQLRWAEAVNADGGDAKIVAGEGSL